MGMIVNVCIDLDIIDAIMWSAHQQGMFLLVLTWFHNFHHTNTIYVLLDLHLNI